MICNKRLISMSLCVVLVKKGLLDIIYTIFLNVEKINFTTGGVLAWKTAITLDTSASISLLFYT